MECLAITRIAKKNNPNIHQFLKEPKLIKAINMGNTHSRVGAMNIDQIRINQKSMYTPCPYIPCYINARFFYKYNL